MSGHQTATIEDTIFFWFAANDTSGSGGDGATPLFDVREAGAAASAAPLLSGTPVLLTNAAYPAGCHEIAVAATTGNGFAADDTFAVFCTLLIDSQNPSGFVGSCTLTPLAKAAALADVPTVAEFEARTIVAAAYFDPAADAVANVTLVATTTTNTDMRGTDNAATAANLATVDTVVDAILVDTAVIGAAGAGLTDLGGMSTGMKVEVNAEVDNALAVTTYAEPSAVPGATVSIVDMIHWNFTLSRNKGTQTSTTKTLRNDADSADIASSTISSDGTTFTRNKYV